MVCLRCHSDCFGSSTSTVIIPCLFFRVWFNKQRTCTPGSDRGVIVILVVVVTCIWQQCPHFKPCWTACQATFERGGAGERDIARDKRLNMMLSRLASTPGDVQARLPLVSIHASDLHTAHYNRSTCACPSTPISPWVIARGGRPPSPVLLLARQPIHVLAQATSSSSFILRFLTRFSPPFCFLPHVPPI